MWDFWLCHLLCAKFHFPARPATGQKLCGGGVVWFGAGGSGLSQF